MEIKIETYYALPCATKEFKINGINADIDDFGDNSDVEPEEAPDYGCGCRKFIGDPEKAPEAMKKYGITKEEFMQVCDKLEDVLYVGRCAWCS